MIKLSIIIVNWNTAKLLQKCIESIFASFKVSKFQSFKEIEIIVVDNGSMDGSVNEIQNSKFKIQNENAKIKIIENHENYGFAKAVNQGIKIASGEAIMLLNSDTRVKPDALEKLIEFEEKVRPVIIGARMLNTDGTVQGSCFYFPTIKRAINQYWLNGKKFFEKYFPKEDSPIRVEAVSGGAMLISREVINKIGILDERYFFYFEDLDYCRRAQKEGIKIWYLPTAEVIHEHGASGKTLANQKNQWKRLIPSSKIYHGRIKHYIISFILWSGQKFSKKK